MTPEAIAEKRRIHDEAQERADAHMARAGITHNHGSGGLSILRPIGAFITAAIAGYIFVFSIMQ